MIQVSDNVNHYQGTTTAPIAGQYVYPNTCPGCGRCKDCGRPYETQPYNPWPGYPNPYIGDTPQWPPLPGTTWISTTTGGVAGNVNTLSGVQAYN